MMKLQEDNVFYGSGQPTDKNHSDLHCEYGCECEREAGPRTELATAMTGISHSAWC